jgi:hypothetical protein
MHTEGLHTMNAICYISSEYQFRMGKKGNANYYIPVIAHNSQNYDLHLMISAVGKFKDKKILCIPSNMEKYISFSFSNLRFIDSLHFLNASLETLVNNLAKEGGGQISKFV